MLHGMHSGSRPRVQMMLGMKMMVMMQVRRGQVGQVVVVMVVVTPSRR